MNTTSHTSWIALWTPWPKLMIIFGLARDVAKQITTPGGSAHAAEIDALDDAAVNAYWFARGPTALNTMSMLPVRFTMLSIYYDSAAFDTLETQFLGHNIDTQSSMNDFSLASA